MANIRSSRDEHQQYCYQPSGGGLGDMKEKVPVDGIGMVDLYMFNRPGDVRRCVHGRIMVGYEVRGVTPCYWEDLHPFFNFFRYRRAVKALAEQEARTYG